MTECPRTSPLQKRVTLWGEIIAHEGRGMFPGRHVSG